MSDALARSLFDSHEDRIQGLEEGQNKLIEQSTKSLVQVEQLSKTVEDSHRTILDKLDEHFLGLSNKFESTGEKVSVVVERVRVLEDTEKSRSAFLGGCRKIAVFAAIGVISVVLTKVGEGLWLWLSR